MKWLTLSAAIAAGVVGLDLAPYAPMERPAPRPHPIKVAVTCFFKYEETSGQNKICYYDCLGSMKAITISALAFCPLSIPG
jgi:hypothetical protein